MRSLPALLPALLLSLGLGSSPLRAEAGSWVLRVTVTEEWVEEGDPRFEQAEWGSEWMSDGFAAPRIDYAIADRAIASYRATTPTALAAYGPFRVIDPTRAVLVGTTTAASPAQFAALLRAFPGLRTLDLVEAPGTENDRANLAVGRMIREAGLTTRVPAGGSVRSGAVELFLAGAQREVEDGARFAVHSWRDNRGREADDFAPGAPEHRYYLDYYREMGMSDEGARSFYAMTNSVPNARARWLDAQDMRGWLARTIGAVANDNVPEVAPRIAYLDVTAAIP